MSEEKDIKEIKEINDKFPTVTTEWSENIENFLVKIADTCKGYEYMNLTTAKNYSLYYNILMYVLIILSPVAGCILIINSDEENAATILSFISGIISAIVKYSRFEEKTVIYKTYASKYSSLGANIRRQLILDRENRPNPGEYLEWANNSYETLFSSAPLISNKIYNQWKEISKEEKEPVNSIKIELPQNNINSEINTYSDEKMKYEMKRLSRHQ